MKKSIYKIIKFLIKLILPIVRVPSIKISVQDANKKISEIYAENEIIESNIQNLQVDENMDLSIIVPIYNAERLLRKCINSIINQKTKYNYEIIAVNDGSTDDSLNILKGYGQIKIIDKENQGVAIARNVGLDNARGKYVAFIDSDDEINEQYIEKLLNRAFEKNADIVKCNFTEYSVSENKVIKYERHKDVSIDRKLKEEIIEFKGFVWGGIFKRELWYNVRFLPQYWYEDMIIRFIIFRKCNQFEYINEDLYIYNNHLNNISKSISKTEDVRCLDNLHLVKALLGVSEKLKLPKDEILYKVLLQELGTMLWLRTRDLKEMYRKFAFIVACDIIKKYKISGNFSFSEKYLEKAFEKKDYCLWKLSCIYIMLGVKIGNE